jgi:hypothetical protein
MSELADARYTQPSRPASFCRRSASTPVTDLLDAADRALQEARGDGPGNVSTWVGDLPD